MNTATVPFAAASLRTTAPVGSITSAPESARLDYLDGTRAFALMLGVVFHASMSFSPYFMGWAVQDISTSPLVADFIQISHSFRMETFFLLAGFFSRGLYHRRGAGEFVRSRALRLGVPFVAGWFLLRPLIVSAWIMGAASLRGDYAFWASLRDGFASLKTLPAGVFTGSHLWFLYYLLMVTTLTLGLRGMVASVDRRLGVTRKIDIAIAWMANSPWALGVLVVPTAGALWFMRFWGMDTPDQSLQPNFPVLAIYGGFFVLGWLFARQPETIARFGRLSAVNAVLALGAGWAVVRLSGIQADPGHPQYLAAHVGFVIGYAMLMWTLVALTLGLFRKFLDHPRPIVRYIADSSYWIYLLHLPVVAWLQVAVAEWDAPWWLKLAGISLATVAIALVTYDLFVRSTFIGAILNGRRREQVLFRFGRTG
jgi:peptidoglycan/LPS O-acetylase OafA/YrhL